jgi:hypothetical protein
MTCKAKLYIADDYGDNHATMHCQLEEGHEGPHKEVFRKDTVVVTWEEDESEEEAAYESSEDVDW